MTNPAINDSSQFAFDDDNDETTPAQSTIEVDLPDVIPDDDWQGSADDEMTYLEDNFKPDREIWKNPRVQIAAVASIALVVVAAVAMLFNSQFSFPGFGSLSIAGSGETKAEQDDTALPDSRDGAWQRQTLRGNLGKGFEGESDGNNDLLQQKTPPTTAKPTTTTTKSAPRPATPRTVVASRPPATTVVRPRISGVPRYSAVRPAVVRASSPRTTAVPRSAPVKPPMTLATKPTTTAQPKPELSPQERLQAALEATSSGLSASTGNGSTTAAAPSSGSNPAPSTPQGYTPVSDTGSYLASETAVIEGLPQQLIDRSTTAEGVLGLGIAFTPEDSQFLQGQVLEIEITNPGETGLPQGSTLLAELVLPEGKSNTKSAPVRLNPVAITVGNAEYPLPQGHLVISGHNGKPLVAKRASPSFLTGFANVVQSIAGNINPLSFLGNNNTVLSSVSPEVLSRLTSQSEPSQVLYLKEQTHLQIRVMKPLSLPDLAHDNLSDLVLSAEEPPAPVAAQRVEDQRAYASPSDQDLRMAFEQIEDNTFEDN
jgi:hypothetical protein